MDALFQRPLTLVEIFLIAWSVFTKQFKNIVLAVALVYVPIHACMFFFSPNSDDPISFRTYLRIYSILNSLIGVVALMAITAITEKYVRLPNEEIRFSEILKLICQRWPFLLWSNLITSFILLGFTLLLVVPGLVFAVYYVFLVPCVVLRNVYGAQARAYSKSLVTGQWWEVAAYLLVIVGVGFALSFGLSLAAGWLASDIFSSVFIDTACDIIQAFFEVAFVIFFLNLDYTKKMGSNQLVDEKL